MYDRHVIALRGADVRPFLQGLVTNDIDKLDDGLLYAALLTPQGKLIADFFLFAQDDAVFLDAAASQAADLKKRLMMYRLRADVTIDDAALQVRRGTGARPVGALDDPRQPAMGWRQYGDQSGDDGTDWDALRITHAIPESGIELTPGAYILEMGFERLNGVDFRKGCYVGQEVTARMKHKTELRKGLQRVAIVGEAPVGTPILSQGKEIGQVFTQSGGEALAYLRFDRISDEMHANDARITVLP